MLSGKTKVDWYSSKGLSWGLGGIDAWQTQVCMITFSCSQKLDVTQRESGERKHISKKDFAKCRDFLTCTHLWSLSPLIHRYPKKHFMNSSLRTYTGPITSNICSHALLNKETWNHVFKFLLKSLGESACKVMLVCYRKEPESAISQGRKKDFQ